MSASATQGSHNKEERRQKKPCKNMMACPVPLGGHKKKKIKETTEQKYSALPYSVGRP